ncbi:MAG: bacterial transcriptional activator domain-containing protein, partial [Deinococcota bacterium]|nr:bacterial transcriptional activator domain-containing protein [Deinococcota bacterium]
LSREWLAEFLWPERPAETSAANLRVALHRLGQKLAPYLLVTRQSVGMNPDGRLYLDAAAFERLLRAEQLTEALDLYGGGFLEGFHLDGSPVFEDWATLERARLHDLAVAALQALIGQRVSKGQADEAMAFARRLLGLEPLHEPAHRILVRLLAQTGRRQAALAHLGAYRQLLNDELGLEPEPSTLALFESIRRGEDSSEDVVEITTATPAPVPRYNVPLATTPLLGRWVELEGLMSRLENPDCRLVTITGPGGIGKTRLALQAALDAAPGFPDGVCFAPLVGVASAEAIIPSIVSS